MPGAMKSRRLQITMMKQAQSKDSEWREVYLDDFGHLRALRGGVILSFITFLIAFGISFYFSKSMLDFILSDGKNIGYSFVYISPLEIMAEQIKLSFLVGIIVTLPVIITEGLLFIKPAIDGSIFSIVKIFLFATILFCLGAGFSYLVLMPFTLNMFYSLGLETQIIAQISVQKYVDLYMALVFALGVVFETPLVASFLARLGLLNSEKMAKGRLIALLVIMAISNIITPTTDILTATMVDVPMYLLYEVSIIVCRRVEKKLVE